ncbi:MAG: hypothetical protein NTU98_14265 [Bacteroidetes bacterium]|nr:hypothetical protein [Bacteroidota bacterium]
MLKRFILILGSLLLCVIRLFSQTISITPTAPIAFCQGDSVTLVAHITGSGYGTDSYSFQQVIPFEQEAFVGDSAVDNDFRSDNGVLVSNHDDTWAGPFPIGFEFCFLNHIYTEYWIGSNGWIGFTNPLNQGWTTYTPFTLPSTNSNVPKNAIFAPYQDWYPTRDWAHFGQYNVFRHIISNPPNNSKLVVYWNNCPMYGCEYNPEGAYPKGTFEIVLNQQNSIIENNITQKPLCSWQSNAATQGVHNADGSFAYIAFNRNQNSWTTSMESTRFVPSGISWYKDAYPGGTLVGQGDSITVIPTVTTTYFAVITTCTNGTATASRTITVYPRPVPVISGTTSVCLNNTEKYTTAAGMTSYTWVVTGGTVVSGGTGTADSVMVKWDNITPPQSISLTYTDIHGCTPVTPTVINVTVNPFITPIITGVNAICIGNQSTFTTQAGNTNYLWTYPGATLISGGTTNDNSVTLAFPTAGTVVVSVNYTGPGGCTSNPPTSKNVTVNPTPIPAYTGPATSCIGLTKTYSTTTGLSNYVWSVSSGGTIASGQGTATITVTWNTLGSQSVTVNYTDLNGCPTSNPPPYAVNVIDLPVPAISGPNSVCKSSTGNTYSTEAGMTGYTWTVTPDGTITSGSGTNSIQVTWATSGSKTISINYTNTGGCTAVNPVTYTVTVHDLPVPTITGNNSLCTGTTGVIYTTQAGMSNYLWTVSASGTITAGGTSTDNTVTVTWNTAGAQTVSINYQDLNSCTAATPVSFPVTVHPLPNPTITGSSAICAGTSGVVYSTQPGMTNYTWIVSGGGTITAGGTSTSNTVTVTWNTPGAQSVSINYNDANGCTATSSTLYPVTINPLPTPTITGTAVVCAGTIGVVYTTQPGMNTYSWIVSAGGTITSGGTSTDNTATVTWNTPGAQSVSINYHDSNGCTAVSSTVYPVTVNALPVPTITGNNSLCAGTTGVIYTTQAGMSNYLWTVSAGGTVTAGGTSTDNTVTVTWNTAGAQTVSVNYQNANNCTAASPVSFPVTVHPLPSPTITGSATLCAGSAGIVYTTQPGMTNYQWIVSGGGTVTAGGTATSSTVTVTWNTPGAQSVSINYTNANGCIAIASTVYPVTVNPLPVPTITGAAVVCAGTTGVVYTTQPGMNTYTWIVSAGGTITVGGTSTDNTATVTWNTPGAQSVSINYHDPNGCTAVSSTAYPVTVNALPVPTITGNNSLCAGTIGVVYTTQAGMSNYLWTVSAGGTITAGGTSADNTVTVTWNTAGAQTVTINYQNSNNCTAASPVSFPVTVHPLPSPTISGTATLCAGTLGVVYTTQPGMTNYQWIVSAGGTVTAGGTATSNTVTVTWNTPGAQSVSINYTNANGCTATASTVYPVTINPLPAPTITGTAVVCAGTAGVVYTTQPGMNTYSWIVSAGGTITSGGSNTDNTVTVTWNTPGAQSVSINYHDPNGCTAVSSTAYPVTVNALPVPTISGNNSLCAGTTGVIYTTQAGMSNYLWTVSAGGTITAGGTSTDNTVTVTWNTAGAQTVTVNYQNINNCTAASPVSFPVTVHPLPSPTISGSATLCAGTTGVVYTTQAGMTSYQWIVSAGGTVTAGGTATSNTVTVTWNTPGAQSVSINYTNANGCTATASTVYTVTVNPLPVPVVTGPAAVCLNSTGIYTTAAGMTNYTWIVSAGGTITGGSGTNSITVLWTTIGAKTITLSYNDANGCTATSPTIYNVTVNLLPVPALTGLNQICVGNSTTYTTDAGMSNYTWAVSAGGAITAGGGISDNTATVNWTGTGAQTVSVNYQMGTGCTAASPTVLNVVVHPLPAPTISGTSILCAGTAGTVYTTQPGMTNYLWTVSPGGTITAGGTTTSNTITITWNTPGLQSVSVNYNDIFGCTALAPVSHPVTVNPLPVPAISGPASACLNATSIYFTDNGMTNYIWSVSAGGTITAGTGTSSITVLWNTSGAKTITVNYLDANGCTASAPTSYPVNVSTLPVPSLTGANSVCEGITQVYTSDAGMTGYTWSVSAGGTVVAGGTSTDFTVTVTWNTAGARSVSVNYQAGPGCMAALPTILNVTVKPRPSITNAANSTVCSGNPINIIPQANLIGTTFSWTATGGSGNVTGFNPGSGFSINDLLLNSGWNNETVTYTVTPSLNGCDGTSSSYVVTVFPHADVYFTPNGQTFCAGGTTSIALASHVAGASFTWTATGSSANVSGFGPGSGTLIAQSLTNSGLVNETVTYHVLPTANACPGTTGNVVVTVAPLPAVTLTPCNDITTTTDAKPFTLKGGLPLGGTYSGAGVNTGIFYPSLASVGTHTILYSFTSFNGCSSSATLNITVLGAIGFTCDNTLTDIRDNSTYPTIKIGTQCWMATNLNYGNLIPSTSMQRDNCVVEKYCFSDNSANCATTGGLYQWDEVMIYNAAEGIQGLCPPGWHIPTENEWLTVFNYYTNNGFAASALKSTGYSGFNALLAGVRFHNTTWDFDGFASLFWSSTSHGPSKAWAHGMNSFDPSVSYYPGNRSNAFPVRCIKD